MKTEFPAQSCTDEAASGVEGAMENEKVDTKEVMHDISCASLELGTHTKKPGQCNCLVAECSRLASRVAILQSALLQAVGEIADYRGVYQDPDTCEQKIAAGVQRRIAEAEKLLAGAHAEEKD